VFINGWLARKGNAPVFQREQLREWVVVLVIAVTVTYSVMYTSLQYYNSDNYAGNSDSIVYLALARGENVETRRSKGARVLTILLVKMLPDPPSAIFNVRRDVTDEWILKVKFALVNSLFLVGTACLIWVYLRRLEFSVAAAHLGMLLFLTSLAVVYSSTIPTVEASSHFFLALCAVAIAYRNRPLFAIAFLVGLFAKESVAFILPLALLAVSERRLSWISAALPGMVVYLGWRVWGVQSGSGDLGHLDPGHLKSALNGIPDYLRFSIFMDLFASFGLLWIPASYALLTGRLTRELQRQYLWIAMLFLVALLVGTGFGRTVFLAFPVVIPGALIGIRAFLARTSTQAEMA
jgi:hypothetical protein